MIKFKDRVKRIFAISPDFKAQAMDYEKSDANLAILLMCVHFLLLLLSGIHGTYRWHRYLATGGEESGSLVVVWLIFLLRPIVVIGMAILFLRLRKQRMASVGFTKKNLKKSLLLAFAFSVIAALISIWFYSSSWFFGDVSVIIRHWPTEFFTELRGLRLFEHIFFLIIAVSLVEELVYRGFLGKRLYGTMRSKGGSIVLTGFLFAIMHFISAIPLHLTGLSHVVQRTSGVLSLVVFYVIFHFVHHWLYAKYNNIAGPILFHTLWNFMATINRLIYANIIAAYYS